MFPTLVSPPPRRSHASSDGAPQEAHRGQQEERQQGHELRQDQGGANGRLKGVVRAQRAALDVTFEKVLRAKLHKNVKYFDEWRAEQRLASASQLVRAAFLPGSKQDCAAASRVASARSWLQAYSEATSATS